MPSAYSCQLRDAIRSRVPQPEPHPTPNPDLALVLAGVALVSCLLPAWWASRQDAAIALRAD